MPELKNDLLLRALLRQPVDMTPIWIMRQAGRYLPEYRETRKRAGDFLTLCKTPELACEVTMQPLARFDLDAAILFSDILTIPDAMGLGLKFVEGDGPVFENPVRSSNDIKRLGAPDPHDALRYVIDAVSVIRQELDGRVPLIGFSGSPWTLATYMVEGGSSKDFRYSKGLLYSDPSSLDHLLETLSKSVAAYLNAQIDAGAQVVMLFDTWGGVLSPDDYRRFSLYSMQSIVEQLNKDANGQRVPVVLFSKGAQHSLEEMAETGCDALGIDWTINIDEARSRVGHQVALQGNLDPSTLYASKEEICSRAKRLLDAFGDNPGHVFNLGHGVHPGVDPDHVKALIDCVHAHSRQLRSH